MIKLFLKIYLNSIELAKPSTTTPKNLVIAIPTITLEPMTLTAWLDLSFLVPVLDMKQIVIWAQNSTPKPIKFENFIF